MHSPDRTKIYWWPWLIIEAALTCATSIAYEKIPASSHALLGWLIAPGLIGELLVGGVHGGASQATREVAWSEANGAFWAVVLKSVFVAASTAIALHRRENWRRRV
jgi:hypothetical protein